MTYRVILSKSVQKQLDSLPESVRKRVIEHILTLSDNPRPHGHIKLKGFEKQYRIRVGNYRVWYEIRDDDAIVEILRCRHRKDIYKK